ncbi:MAG TPA: helix-turn-helix transcriptional regulator [Nocardioides sp.]|jgi:DNA-binding CsgD family transcriptional regulator|nr:helix-turn-helix transcriptional regulator [Nocardioides sp.]
MWLLRNYELWLEFVRELLNDPRPDFPRERIQLRLAETLDTIVSWNWEDPDGSYGFELSHPIDGWPTPEERLIWDSGARDAHPLLRWFYTTQDPRPMTMGRVPEYMVEPGAMELVRELMAPVGFVQQLSIPCHVENGHRAFVAAKDDDDFSDDALQLARLIQPLLALLWLQAAALERCPDPVGVDTTGLSGRELAVLQLLADGLTAEAIGHRLGISPRTVHSHLARLYRKLGVSDRMRAVLIGEAAGLITVDPGVRRLTDRAAFG